MDAIYKECVLYRGKIKGSKTIFRLFWSEKNWFPTKTIQQYNTFSISDVHVRMLKGKSEKNISSSLFGLIRSSKFPSFVSVETGALPKLAHAYYVFPRWNSDEVSVTLILSSASSFIFFFYLPGGYLPPAGKLHNSGEPGQASSLPLPTVWPSFTVISSYSYVAAKTSTAVRRKHEFSQCYVRVYMRCFMSTNIRYFARSRYYLEANIDRRKCQIVLDESIDRWYR